MIGVLFATKKEAEPFLVDSKGWDVAIEISGMGMRAAALATERLIAQDVLCVINAGVCGALNPNLNRGTVHRISTVCVEDFTQSLTLEENGLRLLSVEKPIFEKERREQGAKQADVVDMEGFSVAQVCQEKGVPCLLIKGITDFGDSDGKADIQIHIQQVSKQVSKAVMDVLKEKQGEKNTFKKIRSFTKVEHTLFSLPLLFSGAWIGAGNTFPSWRILGLIALVGTGARIFGMALNRIFDRNIDAKNPRTKNREIPSGALSVLQGYAVAAVGLVLYFLGCAGLGSLVLKLSLFPLIPLVIYSLLKRFTPLCHYGIGFALAAAPLGAFVATSGSLNFSSEIIWLALFTFCWISGFDIIYALLDIDFDRAYHVRSLPASMGSTRALWVAALTHLVAIGALIMLVDSWLSAFFALISMLGFIAGYLPRIPISTRFFPISIIAGIAGALVVLC